MIDANSPIGIFDSGLGGLTVLSEIRGILPYERYIYFADSGFAPYGDKSRNEIRDRCLFIAKSLTKRGIKALVVACNTATSSAIDEMRRDFSFPIVGMEPALKPAIEANLSGWTLVLGTPFTINEPKYQNLLKRFGKGNEIISLPCPGLVELIEKGDADSPETRSRLTALLRRLNLDDFSSVVLGCTHFIYLKRLLCEIMGRRVTFFDGNRGTARQLKRLLIQKSLLSDYPAFWTKAQQIMIDTSGNPGHVIPLCHKLLSILSEAEKCWNRPF